MEAVLYHSCCFSRHEKWIITKLGSPLLNGKFALKIPAVMNFAYSLKVHNRSERMKEVVIISDRRERA